MVVGCHELLGHGVGKLIYRDKDGKASTFTDPITNETYESCYEEGEDYAQRFGDFSGSYEECRADTCAMFLQTFEEVYSLFGFTKDEIEEVNWNSTMRHIRGAIMSMGYYNPDTKKWG